MSISREQKYLIAKMMAEVQERSGVQFDGFIQKQQWFLEKLSGKGPFGFMGNYADSIVSFMYGGICKYARKGFTVFVDGFNPGVRPMGGYEYREIIARTMAYVSCLSVIDINPTIGTSTVLSRVEFRSLLSDILSYDRSSMAMDQCTSYEILVISNLDVNCLRTLMEVRESAKDQKRELVIDEVRVEKVRTFFEEMINARRTRGKMTIITFLSDYASVYTVACTEEDRVKSVFGFTMSSMIRDLANASNNFADGFCQDRRCCRINIPATSKEAKAIGIDCFKLDYEAELIKQLNVVGIAGNDAASIVKSIKEACKGVKVRAEEKKDQLVDPRDTFRNIASDLERSQGLVHGIKSQKLCEFLQKYADVMAVLRSEKPNGV